MTKKSIPITIEDECDGCCKVSDSNCVSVTKCDAKDWTETHTDLTAKECDNPYNNLIKHADNKNCCDLHNEESICGIKPCEDDYLDWYDEKTENETVPDRCKCDGYANAYTNDDDIDCHEFCDMCDEDEDIDIDEDDIRSFNVGNSNYSQHKIQPWDIWEEYDLNPWEADIIKRVLREKSEPGMSYVDSRIMDFKKIIHVARKCIEMLEKDKK